MWHLHHKLVIYGNHVLDPVFVQMGGIVLYTERCPSGSQEVDELLRHNEACRTVLARPGVGAMIADDLE
jgi:hypothetical protein